MRNGENQAAYSALVKLHQGKLRTFLFRLCKNATLTDDLAQETFLQGFRKVNSFSGKGNFSSWLFQIGYNCFLQECRKRRSRVEKISAYAIEAEIHAQWFDKVSAEQLDMERAFLHISSEEAAALTLNYAHGYSHAEIAEITQLPVGTVKTHILRGKEKLRALLGIADSKPQQTPATPNTHDEAVNHG